MNLDNTHLIASLLYLLIFLTACTEYRPAIPQIVPYSESPVKKKVSIVKESSKSLNFQSGIGSILEDRSGNVWIGSQSEGVCCFDGENFTYYTKSDGLSGNQIRSIQEDEKGNIWLDTNEGIACFDGKTFTDHPRVHRVAYNKGDVFSLLKPLPGDWASKPSDLWFHGGRAEGAYRYDGARLSYLAFPLSEETKDENYHFLTDFSKGKNGQVWFATYPGVFGCDGEQFTFIDEANMVADTGIGYWHVRSVLEDSKGQLWIGNNGMGVVLCKDGNCINFSKRQGVLSDKSEKNGSLSPPGSLEHVFAIREDKDGNIWFGDRDTGAWKYDGKSMKNYTMKDGLPSIFVWDIYLNKKGNLWFLTENGSVCEFNGESFEKVF